MKTSIKSIPPQRKQVAIEVGGQMVEV